MDPPSDSPTRRWEQEVAGVGADPAPAIPGDWRPALFALLLHRIVARPMVRFGGQYIAGTACGHTAYSDAGARGGFDNWRDWPICPACE